MVWRPLTSSKIRANIQQNLHCNCRAKMAASFKLSCLVKKRKPPVNFPLLEWRDISIKEQLGSGTFGSVYLVNYEKRRAKCHRKENRALPIDETDDRKINRSIDDNRYLVS